ncbi:MAG: hypothetical protein OEM85_10645 [Gammaproteobacteria bacterium]|nr:hypothetical protein [Gammaproteobacteria bacterium]MDH3373821.1 hypothetical protein [Gammaproteobacteria bacterium]MDH3409447.1 hypothetical protein [Gammaproteobacteria bacterium]
MRIRFSCIALFALASIGIASATEPYPLFQTDEVLKAVLTAPITQAYAQRHQDVRLYLPGQWTYVDADGQTRRLDVSIRTRGHFRREYCQFPPLQLNFKKKQVKGTLFAGQDKLKVVAPCKDKEKYRQYVVLEYLAYKTVEIITEHSFKTRLIRLSYVDSDDKLDSWTDLVFVIEDDADLAQRVGLDRLYLPSVEYSELDHPKTALVQLAQFLIANNDYSVLQGSRDQNCCHNVQVLGLADSMTGRIPVPFDFDMSGLVNTEYAAPPSQVPIRDVRDRYFNGLCQPREILDDAITHVRSKREEIIALFENSTELDADNKSKSLKYVDEFFAILDDPQLVEREIIAPCRGENLLKRMLEASKDST